MTYQPTVSYYVEVRDHASEVEDDGVSGTYELGLAEGYPEETVVTAVLDEFHARVGISVLDDFDICVMDASGNVLVEPDGAEAYSLIGKAVFFGKSPVSPDASI